MTPSCSPERSPELLPHVRPKLRRVFAFPVPSRPLNPFNNHLPPSTEDQAAGGNELKEQATHRSLESTRTFTGTFHGGLMALPERTVIDVTNVFGLQDAKKGASIEFAVGDETMRYRITSWRKHGEGKRFYLKREQSATKSNP